MSRMAKIQLLAVVVSLLAISNSVFATRINIHNGCSYAVSACDVRPNILNNYATCYSLDSGSSSVKEANSYPNDLWAFYGIHADPSQGSGFKDSANIAEFAINDDGMDYYDLSNVAGYNLPMMIHSSNTRCRTPSCTISDVGSFCQAPNVLTGPPGYGCLNTDGPGLNPTNGTKAFKDECPTSCSFSGDDNGTIFSCPTGSDYELVFCPNSTQTSTPPSVSPVTQRPHQMSPLPAPLNQTSSHGTVFSGWKLGISISSGLLFLLVSFLGCAFFVRRTLVSANLEKNQHPNEDEDGAFLDSLPGLPPRFSYSDLEHATEHFSRIIGEGGFGTVYEGSLPDGSKVAVKRLGASKQGQKEFRAEVATIGGINHLRLVRLWGFCSQGAHRMLVYEFLKNGSLDRWLFRESVLDWAVRYQIAIDTAQGLCYLHSDCRHKIIHLDVKPQNILLDDHFRAKVADFGMSKLFDRDLTAVETRMRGTPGYLAPEWLLQTGITEKCDVYSYGMVLLELVSGRKNVDLDTGVEKPYFPAWAVGRVHTQSWDEIMDTRLNGWLTSEEWEQVKTTVKIAMWCIQDKPRTRPSMTKVVDMLKGLVEVDDPPLQFHFLEVLEDKPAFLFSSSSIHWSRWKSQKEQSQEH